MKVIFTDHARERMSARNIQEKDVLYALFSPALYERTYRNRIRIRKNIDMEVLEVIYTEEKDTMIVITCYFL